MHGVSLLPVFGTHIVDDEGDGDDDDDHVEDDDDDDDAAFSYNMPA